jgi:hypothetical protein
MARVLYGPYTIEQLPVLARQPVTECIHRCGAFLYMTLGPLHFVSSIRARHLHFHRWAGRVRTADQVGKLTVFNIGGNRVCLVAALYYNRRRVYSRAVLTQAEYDAGTWKE